VLEGYIKTNISSIYYK